jgi:16S rRNA (guanine527-N7)-methyltransferase
MKRHGARQTGPELIASRTKEIVARELGSSAAHLPPTCLTRVGKMIELLVAWSRITNLTARPEDPAELAFHVMDSLMPLLVCRRKGPAGLAAAFGPGKRVLDIGSGSGFPGLVLAAAVPAQLTLSESRQRRARFLATTAEEMGLFEVTVIAGQLEARKLDASYDLVITRALDSGSDFFKLARAALRRGGYAMLYVSARQADSLAHAPVEGFEDIIKLPYELARGTQKVNRAALAWRRS